MPSEFFCRCGASFHSRKTLYLHMIFNARDHVNHSPVEVRTDARGTRVIGAKRDDDDEDGLACWYRGQRTEVAS